MNQRTFDFALHADWHLRAPRWSSRMYVSVRRSVQWAYTAHTEGDPVPADAAQEALLILGKKGVCVFVCPVCACLYFRPIQEMQIQICPRFLLCCAAGENRDIYEKELFLIYPSDTFLLSWRNNRDSSSYFIFLKANTLCWATCPTYRHEYNSGWNTKHSHYHCDTVSPE